MKICEFEKSQKTNQTLEKFYLAFSIGISGPRYEIPGAEFAEQGGPMPEIEKVYSITSGEKVMNDYINQLDTKLKITPINYILKSSFTKKYKIFLLIMAESILRYN